MIGISLKEFHDLKQLLKTYTPSFYLNRSNFLRRKHFNVIKYFELDIMNLNN
jgi:hypothetical protein